VVLGGSGRFWKNLDALEGFRSSGFFPDAPHNLPTDSQPSRHF